MSLTKDMKHSSSGQAGWKLIRVKLVISSLLRLTIPFVGKAALVNSPGPYKRTLVELLVAAMEIMTCNLLETNLRNYQEGASKNLTFPPINITSLKPPQIEQVLLLNLHPAQTPYKRWRTILLRESLAKPCSQKPSPFPPTKITATSWHLYGSPTKKETTVIGYKPRQTTHHSFDLHSRGPKSEEHVYAITNESGTAVLVSYFTVYRESPSQKP